MFPNNTEEMSRFSKFTMNFGIRNMPLPGFCLGFPMSCPHGSFDMRLGENGHCRREMKSKY